MFHLCNKEGRGLSFEISVLDRMSASVIRGEGISIARKIVGGTTFALIGEDPGKLSPRIKNHKSSGSGEKNTRSLH